MEKKKGTHLVFSGKVCGREEKRFDGECGNFPNRLCCSTAAIAAFPGCCTAAHRCWTGSVARITCAYVKIFGKCYLSII